MCEQDRMDKVHRLFGDQPSPPTEARVREIVRDEIEWALKLAAPPSGVTPAAARRATRDAEMAADFEGGLTMSAIAAKHGCCVSTVSSALKRVVPLRPLPEIPVRDPNAPSPTLARRLARFQEIAETYQSGLSLENTAQKHGCTIGTVRNALRTLGIEARPPGEAQKIGMSHRDDERFTRMKAMRDEGATLEKIATEFGITRERVRQIMNKRGVDTTKRPPTPEERAAVEAYVAGENLEVAASRVGICDAAFKNLVTRCGHAVRKRERATTVRFNERAKRCAALRAEGKSAEEIASIMGIKHREYVYKFLSRAKGLAEREQT